MVYKVVATIFELLIIPIFIGGLGVSETMLLSPPHSQNSFMLCQFTSVNTAQPYGPYGGPPGSSLHGFFRKEYWGILPFPNLPNPRIQSISLMSPELAGRFLTTSTIWEAQNSFTDCNILLTFLWLRSYHSLITYYSSQYVAFIHSLFKKWKQLFILYWSIAN